MDEVLKNTIYLLIIILVPIIPAYLLFKKLKSSAEANGPITPAKSFGVKLGGAFAGYFSIFLPLYIKVPLKFSQPEIKHATQVNAQLNSAEDVWFIKGNVRDGSTGNLIRDPAAELRVVIKPDFEVSGGTFGIFLPSSMTMGKKRLRYKLQIEDKNNVYASSTDIDLDNFWDLRKDSSIIILPDSLFLLGKKPKSGFVDTIRTTPFEKFQ